jgi:type II secretory ATPase GspE/PulE/Tfp pilus assembly ATPase PilB-like protein
MRPEELQESFAAALAARRLAGELSVPETVQMMLLQAAHQRVSDIHLTPEETILRMQWRIDGVLQTAAGFDREFGSRLVARLKFTDLPHGRASGGPCCCRIFGVGDPSLDLSDAVR